MGSGRHGKVVSCSPKRETCHSAADGLPVGAAIPVQGERRGRGVRSALAAQGRAYRTRDRTLQVRRPTTGSSIQARRPRRDSPASSRRRLRPSGRDVGAPIVRPGTCLGQRIWLCGARLPSPRPADRARLRRGRGRFGLPPRLSLSNPPEVHRPRRGPGRRGPGGRTRIVGTLREGANRARARTMRAHAPTSWAVICEG